MLSNLRDFEPLRPAERMLLRSCATGGIAKVSYRRPMVATADVTVRAPFLAYLCRAGGVHIEGRRIEVVGAWIVGRLNLLDAVVPLGLWMYRCTFDTTPLLDGARFTGSVGLPGCSLPGLRAEGCSIAGDLTLNAGCTVLGEVRLSRTTIGRDLNCERLRLRGRGEDIARPRRPLVADGAHIGGDVGLGDGFEALGEVRFVGTRVDGDLRAGAACLTAHLDSSGARGVALNLDRAHVAGSVRLDAGLKCAGRVRMAGVRVEGDIDCSRARFDVVGDGAWGTDLALRLDRARVGGALVLRRLGAPLQGASLEGARVGTLADDHSAWGERLALDGFSFHRLAPDAPADAAFRIDWLARQLPAHLGADWRAAPWRQTIRVLRRMGHDRSARELAIERETRLRQVGRIGVGEPGALRWLLRCGHAAFGALAGYGHRPLRLLAALGVVWILGAVLFSQVARVGQMAPAHLSVYADPAVATCRAATGRWDGCDALPPVYPAFSPLLYSLDQLLPGVDLRQLRHWVPAPTPSRCAGLCLEDRWAWVARWAGVLEGLLGAGGMALLLASLAGLTDRDRRR